VEVVCFGLENHPAVLEGRTWGTGRYCAPGAQNMARLLIGHCVGDGTFRQLLGFLYRRRNIPSHD
jgi:hypothetical protein